MNSINIYAISGLGANRKVFKYLNLNGHLIPLEWVTAHKNEDIKRYSERLSKSIDTSKPFILLGVSFGGLVAIELNQFLKPEKTILISSISTHEEIPKIYRFIGKLGILNVLPQSFFKPPFFLIKWLFGAKNTTLLREILFDTDPKFAKWALIQFITWTNTSSPNNVYVISGEKDKLLPSKKDSNYSLVENGEHFMIVDLANKISDIINEKIINRA